MPDPAVVRLRPPSEVEALDDLHGALGQLWVAAPGVVDVDRAAFTTAVAEVLANVIRHARVPPGACIEVELRAGGDVLRAEIVDDGQPYVPSPPVADDGGELDGIDLLAESGRGLQIARALATVAYARVDGRNRWTVTRP